MSIFPFFQPPAQAHPDFGTLQYARGHWVGTAVLEQAKRIPLRIPGARSGPDPSALRTAEQLVVWWTTSRRAIERELYDHYSAGRNGDSQIDVSTPAAVWNHVVLSSIQVKPYRSNDEVQVALRVAWDEEHTLGALIRDGQFVELNGSILEPR